MDMLKKINYNLLITNKRKVFFVVESLQYININLYTVEK